MMQQLIKMLFDLTENDSVTHFHLDIIIIRLVSLLLMYVLPLWMLCAFLLLNFDSCKEYGRINGFPSEWKIGDYLHHWLCFCHIWKKWYCILLTRLCFIQYKRWPLGILGMIENQLKVRIIQSLVLRDLEGFGRTKMILNYLQDHCQHSEYLWHKTHVQGDLWATMLLITPTRDHIL